jgi:FkbM family methyltransferase
MAKPSRAFFDFGSHLGDGLRQLTDILGIDSSWEIHLFEPNPFTDTVSALQGYPNPFHLSRSAVWSSSTELDFLPQAMIDNRCRKVITSQGLSRQPIFDGMGSAVATVGSCEPGLGGVRVRVPAIGIVEALERTSAEDIYIKMDIEASEYEVLDALLSDPIANRVRTAYVEWHRTSDGLFEARKQAIKAKSPFLIHDWH